MENRQLFHQLSQMIYEHKCYYTISFGLSELFKRKGSFANE